MTPEQVRVYYDNGYNFKKVTGMSRNSLHNWFKCGFVPFLSQKKLEKLTNGSLIAEWDDKELNFKVRRY